MFTSYNCRFYYSGFLCISDLHVGLVCAVVDPLLGRTQKVLRFSKVFLNLFSPV